MHTNKQNKISKIISFYMMLFIFTTALIVSPGCKTIVSDNKTKNKDKIQLKVDDVSSANTAILENETNKFSLISDFSYGIQYTLKNDDLDDFNKLWTSDIFNTRILSVSGYPSISNINMMEKLVNDLNSQLKLEQERGKTNLNKKDKEIENLLKDKKELEKQYTAAVANLTEMAKKQADKADDNSVIVDNVNKYFGLGAVMYGVKKFVSTFTIIILVVIIVYLVLRVLATFNPIASAIFSVVEMIISYIISFIKLFAPNATKYSGLSNTTEVNKYKNTLEKIVDSIETLQASLPDTEKGKVTLTQIMTEFSSSMDSSDKTVVRDIKSELKW